jgi:RNA polymerase sigma-70 factor (ECF subfamily)
MTGKLLVFRRPEAGDADLSDAALVAACAAGDSAALAALFDRHGAAVHRFVARLAGVDDHAVDDLVQDVFLQAFCGARGFRGGSAVRTWLLGIAVNLARHHVRSDARSKSRGAVFLTRAAAEPPTPAARAERAEFVERLGRAVDELPHDLRAAFLLCDVEGVRGVDAARTLGVREGTLYRRLHEARLALRRALGETP